MCHQSQYGHRYDRSRSPLGLPNRAINFDAFSCVAIIFLLSHMRYCLESWGPSGTLQGMPFDGLAANSGDLVFVSARRRVARRLSGKMLSAR